jgi:hypothetical protein
MMVVAAVFGLGERERASKGEPEGEREGKTPELR